MADPLHSWLEAFAQVDAPHKRRGVRHPFTLILALAFLGLLCRETDFACLRRWAADHWGPLKPALGFTREKLPHATTISRALARFSLAQFCDTFEGQSAHPAQGDVGRLRRGRRTAPRREDRGGTGGEVHTRRL